MVLCIYSARIVDSNVIVAWARYTYIRNTKLTSASGAAHTTGTLLTGTIYIHTLLTGPVGHT